MPSDPSYRFPSVRLAVCLDNVSVAGAVSRPFRQRDATGHLPGGQGAIMATDARAELRVDVHAIEPIPEADRDSTGLQQMWIWAGANIAPINWALGALGIVLKLGLWETIAVIVLGNIVGCGIFAAFTVMGHKTGVNQMVLQRSAFGRRGAYLPSALMFLMTLGWIGVNTYFPVKIAVAILGQFGIGDTWLTNFVVVTVVMVIQVLKIGRASCRERVYSNV